MKLLDLLILYIKEYYLIYNPRPLAVDLYRTIKRNFVDVLDNKRIKQVNAFDIQSIYNDLKRKGWKSSTIYIFDSNIRKIFNFALNKSLISRTPFDTVKRPQLENPKESMVIKEADLTKIIKASLNHESGRVFLILLMTGIKVSELISLRHQDVDLDKRLINIEKERLSKSKKDNPFTESKKKRTILIPHCVLSLLIEELEDEKTRKMKPRSRFFNEYDLFFTHMNGMPLTKELLKERWDTVLDGIGFPRVRLNDFTRMAFARILSKDDKYDRAIIHYLGLESTTQYYSIYKEKTHLVS